MITFDQELQTQCKERLQKTVIARLCIETYAGINNLCDPLPIDEKRDFAEALLTKKFINDMIQGWVNGCRSAELDPAFVQAKLMEIET